MVKHLETFMLLLILGVSAFMTQVSAQISAVNFDGLLLEVVLQPSTGNPTGSRVFNDGRYEFLSDFQIVVASDGSSTRQTVPLAWREEYVFTPSELSELQDAINAANITDLDAVYPPTGQTFNTSTMTWRVLVNSQVKQIVVQGFPINKVPALEKLYLRFNSIHKEPKASSIWRVLTQNGVVQRTIDCDVSGVDFLRPVLQALFASDQLDSSGTTSALPAADAVLLEIFWKENGLDVETTRLYGDGRYELSKNGVQSLVKTLSPAQIVLVLQSLQAIDWQHLPEPVCE
jgi:hypothetical protein